MVNDLSKSVLKDLFSQFSLSQENGKKKKKKKKNKMS